ncbi:MAG: argininosuccinate lyase, partial [Chloroflexi bacterium]|nr:argininosuccinate lyase [Chloroflexota bacterium]
LLALQLAFLDLAARNDEAVIPGYTHLQRAQPVLLGHHLLAYFEMFQRDVERFLDAYKRADVLPLGSGALAGVPYPLDREAVAKELGFLHISRNSLDAVSDRDFAVEYLAAASLTMAHLSRFGEEVVLWSSAEFGFVEVDDAYATGSSIMPQKKNPDVAELVRGKTGRVYGDLIALLTILKGLPLSYNRDLQEDKEPLFDAVDTLQACLEVTAGLVRTLTFHADRTRQAAGESYTLATDLADYLAKRGLPFRQAHEVVGQIVRHCIAAGKQIQDLTLEEYRGFSPLFQADILQLSVDSALAARDVHGGTAPARVRFALSQARCVVDNTAKWAERSE